VPLAEHVQVSATLIDAATSWLAEPTPTESPIPGPDINATGIRNFIIAKIVPILLAVLGVIFISRAGKGEMSRVLTSTGIAILGLAFVAGAAALFAFGLDLVELILPTPTRP
jgi:hypothetical protein